MEKDYTHIEKQLRIARSYLVGIHPYFAPALFRAKSFLFTEKIPYSSVDRGLNMYFNPKKIEEVLNKAVAEEAYENFLHQMAWLMVHHVSHIIRGHAQRAIDNQLHPLLWEAATDMEINDSLWNGLEFPEDYPVLLPKTFKYDNDKLAEKYYEQLSDDGISIDVNLVGGSGVHGQPMDGELNGGDGDGNGSGSGNGVGSGGMTTGEALSELDLKALQNEIAKQMKEAGKDRGNIPAGWQRWVEKIQSPKVDWRKKIRTGLRTAMSISAGAKMDYTYSRPSRRASIYGNIIFPSLRGDQKANIAVVVDTSGSIGTKELRQSLAEIGGILDSFNAPVTIIPCDSEAYEPIVVKSSSDYQRITSLSGGGGTDMRVGIQAALDLKTKPDAILVLTDGYTPYPSAKYKVDVIFGIWKYEESNYSPDLPPNPPFGEDCVVEIPLSRE